MAHVTFFKEPKPSAKVQRALRRISRDNDENRAKAEVRRRDKGCRFPGCGCRRLRLALEVSHNEHKGMGGNPKGDRSTPELMMQLCRERHQANPVSIHSGRIWWEPVIRREGANGCVRWMVDAADVRRLMPDVSLPSRASRVEFARELAPGAAWAEVAPGWEPFVERLAEMVL